LKHWQSNLVGVRRTVVTFIPSYEGSPTGMIRSYEIKSVVEYQNGSVQFIDEQGKTHSWPSNLTWVDEVGSNPGIQK